MLPHQQPFDPNDPIVVFIARAGLADRMLSRHVDDGSGRCEGCSWQQSSRPIHPCVIRFYAEKVSSARPHTP